MCSAVQRAGDRAARGDLAVAERLRRVDNHRMEYARELFGKICSDPDEIETRALLTFCL
ncbi:hypothetical protein [Nocardia sp. NPDC052112]|uniref:hypothetical protein n=1 Tax=Nocardia sp. NPDC052112 TaxID=3155646 RepID=UPI00344765FA